MKKSLLKNLELLGYPLLEIDEDIDANETLAEVVKSRDARLWEGFPLLLANSLQKGYFNYHNAEAHLKNLNDKAYFHNLIVLSLALYKYLRLKFSWIDKIKNSEFFNKRLFDEFLKSFEKSKDLSKEVKNLSSLRIVNTFNRYFKEIKSISGEYTQMKDEFDLAYSLSQVFSKKQKELFMKRLKNERMTKTEREYYSRSVKRKVLALANPDLHRLAVRLTKE